MKALAAALPVLLALSTAEGPAAPQDLRKRPQGRAGRQALPRQPRCRGSRARTLWPADDNVTVRLGTALVLANKSADAVKVLWPYLDALPTDQEVLLVALRALYETRAAGRAVETIEADKLRFIRYADAYAAAKGSQRALVDQWRKYIESRR